ARGRGALVLPLPQTKKKKKKRKKKKKKQQRWSSRMFPDVPDFRKEGRQTGAWRMMNFRQRMGWIGVAVYLLVSIAGVYYMFEINQTYNRLTLEKTGGTHPPPQRAADSASSPFSLSSWMQSVKSRLLLLPFWLWALLFLLPYLQVFLFLYSCTRADPKTVGYCILPVCLALLCNRHTSFTKASNQISRLQLIDT
ncbi:hypothetical protein QTP86_032561, partial [Hemibagrus guttatus]